jgi:type VI protein secretion system component Hcp
MAWYVQFDGVDGSSVHKDHQKWCIASSINMSGHKAGSGGTGVSRVGGKMHLEDVNVGIISDKALPKLLEAAVKGKVFPKVTIHGTATYGNEGEKTYLEVLLEQVQITSYQLGVLDNDAATDDLSMMLNFEKFKTKYTAYSKEGKSDGNVEAEWKVEEGE